MNQLKKLVILILLILVIQLKITDYNAKCNDIEKKVTDHDHDKYATTQKFNKSTSDNFTARRKQANLASKNGIASFMEKADFGDKLKNSNQKLLQIKQNIQKLKINQMI